MLGLLKNEEYFEFIRRAGKEASSLTAPVALTKEESDVNRKYEESASRITAIGNEWAAVASEGHLGRRRRINIWRSFRSN